MIKSWSVFFRQAPKLVDELRRLKVAKPERVFKVWSCNQCSLHYLWESLEKANAWTPAEWPFKSNARATSLNSPPFPKQTSHTFTSGVKPHDATNLSTETDSTAQQLHLHMILTACSFYVWSVLKNKEMLQRCSACNKALIWKTSWKVISVTDGHLALQKRKICQVNEQQKTSLVSFKGPVYRILEYLSAKM